MTKKRIEPVLWLLFSGGGVLSAVFLPVLLFLFGLAFPLEWIDPPSHGRLLSVAGNPLTLLFLLALLPMSLFHWAHRFRYGVQHGFQVGIAEWALATLCYGAALIGSFITLLVLVAVATA
jgi:fumarate reductase subunit D